MVLTFNMRLFTAPNAFLLFGYLQPGKACATDVSQGEVQSMMRKGLRRDVQLKGAFPDAVIWVSNKPLSWEWLNHRCGVCSQEGSDRPAAGYSCQLWQGWERKHEIFSSSTSLWLPQSQSPPWSPFTFGSNKSALHTDKKHGQEKKRTPIFREENQQWAQPAICGLLGRTQIAFLSWLHAAIEEGLQHLRPWHCHLRWDLELLQEAQETCTSGQKLEAGSTPGCSEGWMI